jgi:hypothetical protein
MSGEGQVGVPRFRVVRGCFSEEWHWDALFFLPSAGHIILAIHVGSVAIGAALSKYVPGFATIADGVGR